MTSKSNSILAAFHKQLGDTLLLEPALAKLRGPNEVEDVYLATRAAFRPLVELMPAARPARWSLRMHREAWAFDLSTRSSLAILLARARRRIFVVKNANKIKWYQRIFEKAPMPPLKNTYRALFYWNIVPGASDVVFRPPVLNDPPGAWGMGLSAYENSVVLHPCAAWARKTWSPEKWANVAIRLRSAGLGPIVLTSGCRKWEMEHAARIASAMNHEIVNLGGRTNLKGLLWLVRHARLVLAVDGAASHIAAAFRRPCVTLFGPTNSNVWHLETPYSRCVNAADIAKNPDSDLSSIDPEIVTDKALALA